MDDLEGFDRRAIEHDRIQVGRAGSSPHPLLCQLRNEAENATGRPALQGGLIGMVSLDAEPRVAEEVGVPWGAIAFPGDEHNLATAQRAHGRMVPVPVPLRKTREAFRIAVQRAALLLPGAAEGGVNLVPQHTHHRPTR